MSRENAFETHKLAFEQATASHFDYMQHGFDGDLERYYFEGHRLCEAAEAARAVLLAAPAISLEDVAYKLELSIGELGECCESAEDIALLKRALIALRAGRVKTARKLVTAALNSDLEYDFNAFAYEGAAAALEDLMMRGSAAP